MPTVLHATLWLKFSLFKILVLRSAQWQVQEWFREGRIYTLSTYTWPVPVAPPSNRSPFSINAPWSIRHRRLYHLSALCPKAATQYVRSGFCSPEQLQSSTPWYIRLLSMDVFSAIFQTFLLPIYCSRYIAPKPSVCGTVSNALVTTAESTGSKLKFRLLRRLISVLLPPALMPPVPVMPKPGITKIPPVSVFHPDDKQQNFPVGSQTINAERSKIKHSCCNSQFPRANPIRATAFRYPRMISIMRMLCRMGLIRNPRTLSQNQVYISFYVKALCPIPFLSVDECFPASPLSQYPYLMASSVVKVRYFPRLLTFGITVRSSTIVSAISGLRFRVKVSVHLLPYPRPCASAVAPMVAPYDWYFIGHLFIGLIDHGSRPRWLLPPHIYFIARQWKSALRPMLHYYR